MTIRFKEQRRLLDNSLVEPDRDYTFTPEEEQAFVDNGVADFVTTTKPAPKGAKEATDNG
jgi:hypothetical protein